VDGASAGGLCLEPGVPLNSHLGPIGTSGEEKEEEQESEEQEVRGEEGGVRVAVEGRQIRDEQEMTEAAATAAAAAGSAAEAAVAAAVMREEMVGVESELVVAELGRMREIRGRERIGQRLQNCREDGRQLREALRCRVEAGQRMEEAGAVMRAEPEMTEAAAAAAAAAVSAAEAAVAAAVMWEEMVGVESELVVAELGRMREIRGRERIGHRLQNCREDGRQLREALRCRVEEGQRMEEEGESKASKQEW
jgi:hypothetical protein